MWSRAKFKYQFELSLADFTGSLKPKKTIDFQNNPYRLKQFNKKEQFW